MFYIDYSQMRLWHFCNLAWYSRYILGLRRRSSDAPADDALTLGSLFHEGMENWYLRKDPRISEAIIAKLNPSKECLDVAAQLVLGYSRHYPQDPWTTISVEEALKKPLTDGLGLVAKVDQIARVVEPVDIDSGHQGLTFRLEPGIYSIENKTKAQQKPFAGYLQSWQANMQASFQLLALREKYGDQVKGVIVNVAEKPNFYKARRKCQKCEQTSELKMWLIDSTNLKNNKCPLCLHSQKLKPYEPKKINDPRFYRIVVTRNQERLEKDLIKIHSVGTAMLMMKLSGETGANLATYENDENCINPITMRSKCDYFEAHVNNVPVDNLVGDTLEKIDDPFEYIGMDSDDTDT